MTVDQVRELFDSYTANKGKAARLEAEIRKLRVEIAQLRSLDVDTLKATNLDGMPHGKGGRSDPTGVKAVKRADGQPLSSDEAKLTKRLNDKQAEHTQLKLSVDTVDGWLAALMDREKLILSVKLIERQSWRVVATQYEKRCGDDMSEDTLRRMQDRTLGLIAMQM